MPATRPPAYARIASFRNPPRSSIAATTSPQREQQALAGHPVEARRYGRTASTAAKIGMAVVVGEHEDETGSQVELRRRRLNPRA
jgi:hypothetical protein